MRLQSRWLRNLLITAVVSALALWTVDWWLNASYPTLQANRVESIEIHLFDEPFISERAGQVASKAIIDDEQAIRKLLAVFAGAHRGKEHKASRSGAIVVCLKDGGREELSILPGYRDDRYEYRYAGRINYIDRAQFLAALETVGILNIALVSHQ